MLDVYTKYMMYLGTIHSMLGAIYVYVSLTITWDGILLEAYIANHISHPSQILYHIVSSPTKEVNFV